MSNTKAHYGLIGWPVAHSVSPAMMNAAFASLHMDATYHLHPIETDRFTHGIQVFMNSGIRGFNVTIPHKQAIVKHVNRVTTEAETVGAVNTVWWDKQDGGWVGHNTDMDGWWQSVQPVLPKSLATVTVLGSGGAARAAVAALARYAEGARVYCVGRHAARTKDLLEDFGKHLDLVPSEWGQRHTVIGDSQLIVQCTPVGMWPNHAVSPICDDTCLGSGQIVQDMVYRPLETAFLHQAKARGATVVDGLGMLVQQGALAFQRWFERPAPVSVMDHAARRTLAKGSE